MAIVTEELLTLARELAEQESEVHWRSAVSRAYYCCYHECRAIAARLPEAPYAAEPKGMHDRIIKQFTTYSGGAQKSRSLRAIGYILAGFKELRTTADYDIAANFSRSTVSEAFQYVDNIRKKLKKLEQLLDESPA